MQGIGNAGILCNDTALEIDLIAVRMKYSVLHQCAGTDGVEDLWFLFFCQSNTFCIATTFKIEDVVFCPAMLVVTYKFAVRISAQCSLTRTAQSKENGRVAGFTHVG